MSAPGSDRFFVSSKSKSSVKLFHFRTPSSGPIIWSGSGLPDHLTCSRPCHLAGRPRAPFVRRPADHRPNRLHARVRLFRLRAGSGCPGPVSRRLQTPDFQVRLFNLPYVRPSLRQVRTRQVVSHRAHHQTVFQGPSSGQSGSSFQVQAPGQVQPSVRSRQTVQTRTFTVRRSSWSGSGRVKSGHQAPPGQAPVHQVCFYVLSSFSSGPGQAITFFSSSKPLAISTHRPGQLDRHQTGSGFIIRLLGQTVFRV